MRLCDDGHDEVCYEGRECPVCVALGEVEVQKALVSDLEKQVKDLDEQIDELKDDDLG